MSRSWSLMHPLDVAQVRAEILERQRAQAAGTAVCAPNRVYDALNHDTGFDHARSASAQLITWDKTLGRYRRATLVDVPRPVDKLAKDVKHVVGGSANRYRSGSV